MLAVLAAQKRYSVKVADVETAFLVPKMDKVVYVKALLWYEQLVAAANGSPVRSHLTRVDSSSKEFRVSSKAVGCSIWK